jgi:hypothetical protein
MQALRKRVIDTSKLCYAFRVRAFLHFIMMHTLCVVENSCSRGNGNCSHLCLSLSNGQSVCECANGWQLDLATNNTCICKFCSCTESGLISCSTVSTVMDGSALVKIKFL